MGLVQQRHHPIDRESHRPSPRRDVSRTAMGGRESSACEAPAELPPYQRL
jgi:hypothetical protein